MSKDMKKKVIKNIIWSIAFYGSETWTQRKYERDRLKAFFGLGEIRRNIAGKVTRPTNWC